MEFSNLPTSIGVTLYKYNHIDNQLWTRIYNELDYIQADKDTLVVHVDQIIALIQKHYQPLLKKIGAVGSEFVHKEVNSVYFITLMLEQMENLMYIKFTRSLQKKYSRMIEDDEQKMIRFDFKVLTATFRMSEFFSTNELHKINRYLIQHGILTENVPYTTIQLSKFLNTVELIINKAEDDSVADLFAGILDIIEVKIDSDNPTLMLVTDY
jgi:hypothetical protein